MTSLPLSSGSLAINLGSFSSEAMTVYLDYTPGKGTLVRSIESTVVFSYTQDRVTVKIMLGTVDHSCDRIPLPDRRAYILIRWCPRGYTSFFHRFVVSLTPLFSKPHHSCFFSHRTTLLRLVVFT